MVAHRLVCKELRAVKLVGGEAHDLLVHSVLRVEQLDGLRVRPDDALLQTHAQPALLGSA